MADVWKAYENFKAREKTLRWLVKEFLNSERFKNLKHRTQDQYDRQSEVIMKTPLRGGRLFGDVYLDSITPGVIRRYLDRRARTSPVAGNREVAFLSSVFSWGYERELCGRNPCKGVRRERERPRERYVTDEEYDRAVYRLALEHAPPYIPIGMEIAYLCRARGVEIRELTRFSMRKEVLYLKRHKNSKSQIVG